MSLRLEELCLTQGVWGGLAGLSSHFRGPRKPPPRMAAGRRQDHPSAAKDHRDPGARGVSEPARGGCAPALLGGISTKGAGWLVLQGKMEGTWGPGGTDPGLLGPLFPQKPESSEASEETIVRAEDGAPRSTKGHPSRDTGLCHQGWRRAGPHPSWHAKGLLLALCHFFVFVSSFKRKMVGGPAGLHLRAQR